MQGSPIWDVWPEGSGFIVKSGGVSRAHVQSFWRRRPPRKTGYRLELSADTFWSLPPQHEHGSRIVSKILQRHCLLPRHLPLQHLDWRHLPQAAHPHPHLHRARHPCLLWVWTPLRFWGSQALPLLFWTSYATSRPTGCFGKVIKSVF